MTINFRFLLGFTVVLVFLSLGHGEATETSSTCEASSQTCSESNASQPAPKKKSSHPVRRAKKNTNDALDSMEKGLKGAAHNAKEGANDVLNHVDKAVHEVINK